MLAISLSSTTLTVVIQVSEHVHEVFGGSGFSENYDYDQLVQSRCTTMPIPQDFSNYWVVSTLDGSWIHLTDLLYKPPMYYVDPNNGSYTLMSKHYKTFAVQVYHNAHAIQRAP